MKKLILILIILFSLICPNPTKAGMPEVYNATVKISGASELTGDNQSGTGVVFLENKEEVFILTATHVVYGMTVPRVQFFNSGKESDYIPASFRKMMVGLKTMPNGDDICLLTVKKSDIGKYPIPKPIPLGFIRTDRILTVGCQTGEWPSLQKGSIVNGESDSFIRIEPRPTVGRSGSGVFDEKGEHVIGIVLHTTGYCISSQKIAQFLVKPDNMPSPKENTEKIPLPVEEVQ